MKSRPLKEQKISSAGGRKKAAPAVRCIDAESYRLWKAIFAHGSSEISLDNHKDACVSPRCIKTAAYRAARSFGPVVLRKEVKPPAKPWQGILPASLSRGTEYSVFCITCPATCKRDSSHYVLTFLVLNTIPLRSKLAAKAFLLSPAKPGGVSWLIQKARAIARAFCVVRKGGIRKRYRQYSSFHI